RGNKLSSNGKCVFPAVSHRRGSPHNTRGCAQSQCVCLSVFICVHLWPLFLFWALRENSEKRPIGGDLSVLPFLGWLASGFQPGAADLGQLPAESIAVSESLESWNSRIVRG